MGATPQVIMMLFDGLIVAVGRGPLPLAWLARAPPTSDAVRILEEGLKAGLDMERGGELAVNTKASTTTAWPASPKPTCAALADVVHIIEPLVEAGAASPARSAGKRPRAEHDMSSPVRH